MEESIVHCLPPLVQGKLAGVFEFTIEKIKITEKIFTNNISSLFVKVLWWGETKPLFVRPNKIEFISKDNNEVTINEPAEHSVKYEVHTNLKLFKSYLEKCEVVELVILNSLQNEVVGSAFLRNLIHLVFYTRFFNSPVINHSGESIGEISCQVSFKEVNTKNSSGGIETNAKVSPVKKWSGSNLKINLNTLNLDSSTEEIDRVSKLNMENNSSRVFNEFSTHRKNAMLNDLNSNRSSNLHYNSPVTENPELKVDSKFPDMSEYSVKGSEVLNDCLKSSSSTCINFQEEIIPKPPVDLERTKKSLLIDSSTSVCKTDFPVEPPKGLLLNAKDKKIMNKSKNSHLLNKRQEENFNKNRIRNTGPSSKIINKKNITSKVKSYIENKAQKNKNNCTERASGAIKKNQQTNVTINQKRSKTTNGVMIPSANIKSFLKVSKEISKLNKLYLNSKDFNNDNSDLEKVPVKEIIPCNGSRDPDPLQDVNKKGKDNEKNINVTESWGNLKLSEMSNKEYESGKFGPNKEQGEHHPNLEKVNVDNKLRFDLNDPIEKLYYETFFLKTQNVCNNEFEIAELLNQPENKYILEVTHDRTFDENAQQLDNHILSEKGDNSSNTHFYPDKNEIRKDDRTSDEKLFEPGKLRKDKDSCVKYKLLEPVTDAPQESNLKIKSPREYKTDCHRCKYYKKLSELDKIIESLKIFETRLKNEVVLSSLSLNADDSSKNFTHGRPILPRSNPQVQTVRDSKFSSVRHTDEELSLEPDNYGSEFSKEDSDFIEFTHYLSKR